MGDAARRIPTAADVAGECARLAAAAGVRVDVHALERALADLGPAELARVPASYAQGLADAAAAGIDLNDPCLDEVVFEGSAEDAIRFLEGADRCASSG